jgi:hypothetical protein
MLRVSTKKLIISMAATIRLSVLLIMGKRLINSQIVGIPVKLLTLVVLSVEVKLITNNQLAFHLTG